MRELLGVSILVLQLMWCYGEDFTLLLLLEDSAEPSEGAYNSQKIRPGIDIAVEKVNIDTRLLPGDSIEVTWADSACNRIDSVIAVMEEYGNVDIHGFLGPACWNPMEIIGVMAAQWNLPVISGASEDPDLSNKDMFKTLTRTYAPLDKLAIGFSAMIEDFDIQLFGLIYDDVTPDPFILAFAVYYAIEYDTNGTFSSDPRGIQGYNPGKLEDDTLLNIVSEVSLVSRIIILCGTPDHVREMMLHAYDLGLINGEYLFFDMQPNQDENVENFPWKRNDDRDDDARVAYQALMTVTIKRPTSEQFVQFSEEVRLRALRDYNYNYTDETVNNFVGAFHDAVLLYAIALNETLNEGSDPKDGYNITRKMWNRTFEGITGNVSIDANGDINADYSILDMTDPETGKFEPVINIEYTGAVGVVEKVGIIHWPGGASGPPDDVPACGFFNEYCPVADTFPVAGIVGIVIACLLILALIVVVFLYRKYKLESEIANMTWKIKYEDITFSHVNKSRFLSLNVMNKSMLLDNEDDMAEQQIFANVGHYKGSFVAVKKIHKERIDLNRDILIELKNMREVEHGHIVRFIGACVDSPCIAIVTEYCPKGSLQDILQNDSLQLDWMFRYSLINDIVKGLHFLHHSVMKRHGNLSSSNCVVDSRFVLKLADFGLEKFKANSSSSDNAFGELTKKLWVAPEVLRDPASTKTQEGDIFSLAIILHEIGSRNAPYDAETGDMSVKEIIERIKKGESPPFRPQIDRNLYPNEVRNLMESCWEENPSLRPNINAISATIKKLNRSESHSDNIMDNLLQRMEQYANNLESLVEQRTEAFLEEKKKSEQLLYSILPNSVAKQLIRGERVEPESFDCVTVYFSDIVGFTALSAGSTPLQVVDMLNDLYICFDALISNFDVYKVETIGDAYMVASGLPIRNGNRHAREVARMSLALLKAVLSFKIKHQPNHQMRLRIGIHSGPCVAGVVGLKMPRYCLFGDTVNTASRMESNGEPLKIHLSSSTHAILDTFYTFKMELRGEIEMKGKGMQTTHWLLGESLDVKDSNS